MFEFMGNYSEYLFKFILVFFLSGLIGYERSIKSRAAGLRTHVLVGMASALVMMTSEYIFQRYSLLGATPDPSRLGAQVISGIGFLGAGTILKGRGSVKGLTTAASLWSVGAIGLSVGIGFYIGAIFTTFFMYVVLRFAKIIEGDWINRIITTQVFIQTSTFDTSVYENIASKNQVFLDSVQYLGNDKEGDRVVHSLLITLNPRTKQMNRFNRVLEEFGRVDGTMKLKVIGENNGDE